jgi:hypothetical protein
VPGAPSLGSGSAGTAGIEQHQGAGPFLLPADPSVFVNPETRQAFDDLCDVAKNVAVDETEAIVAETRETHDAP